MGFLHENILAVDWGDLKTTAALEENRLEEEGERGCKELRLDATRAAGPEGKRSGQIWSSNWQDLFLHWTPTSCWVCLSNTCSCSGWLCLSENQLRRLSTQQTKAVSAAVWLFWSHRHGLNNSLILSIDSVSNLVSVELDFFILLSFVREISLFRSNADREPGNRAIKLEVEGPDTRYHFLEQQLHALDPH